MASSYAPAGVPCANCGRILDATALVCPNCQRLVHADRIEALATQARQFTAVRQFQAARSLWLQVLELLPSATTQYEAVQREIQKLDRILAPPAIPAPGAQAPNWTKRLGPLGVVLAALLKFKSVLFILGNLKAFLSVAAFLAIYWNLFGWWFAFGFVVGIVVHEMGHYVTARRYGFAAELPVFIPFFGAYVRWRSEGNVHPVVRARISLAGPFFGFVAAGVSLLVYFLTGKGVWLAVAHVTAAINLLNLTPAWIFDGASVLSAVGRQERWAVLLVSLVLAILFHDVLFVFLAAGTAYRIYRRDEPAEPSQATGYSLIALAFALGMLSWISSGQAEGLVGKAGAF